MSAQALFDPAELLQFPAGLNPENCKRLMVRRPSGGKGDFMGVMGAIASWADTETSCYRVWRVDLFQDHAVAYTGDGLPALKMDKASA